MRRLALIAACLALIAGCTRSFDDRAGDRPTIDVFGPYLGREADAFAASMSRFEDETGVRVRYTGSADFAADLRRRVAGGIDAPDVALVPQPGAIDQLIEDHDIVPLSARTIRSVTDNYDLSVEELTGGAGAFVVPYRVSVKSVVWYRPDLFRHHGWTVPRTLADLNRLVAAIRRAGDVSPWCFSIFSGSSTGWPATDWVEDVLLRRAGTTAYDDWVAGRLAFDSPPVRAAFEEFDAMVLGRGRTAGGLRSILQTPIMQASGPLFADPAGCALYKQASFAASWFPEGTDIGPRGDVNFFVLPGVRADRPAPLVVGGDGAVQFNRREDVNRLMTYLATADGARAWARTGRLRQRPDARRYAHLLFGHRPALRRAPAGAAHPSFRRLRPDAPRGGLRSALEADDHVDLGRRVARHPPHDHGRRPLDRGLTDSADGGDEYGANGYTPT